MATIASIYNVYYFNTYYDNYYISMVYNFWNNIINCFIYFIVENVYGITR